jgi:hypothetical protein
MRRVRLTHPRPDCVLVDVGRDWRQAAGIAAGLTVVVALMLSPEAGTFAGILALVLGALTCVPLGVLLARALTTREHLLVRSTGRLLLDGDPLEMARVELRVTQWPLINRPTGYALSLWVMTLVGPDEVPLGQFATMLEAATLSGELEDFIGKANARQQPRHV